MWDFEKLYVDSVMWAFLSFVTIFYIFSVTFIHLDQLMPYLFVFLSLLLICVFCMCFAFHFFFLSLVLCGEITFFNH